MLLRIVKMEFDPAHVEISTKSMELSRAGHLNSLDLKERKNSGLRQIDRPFLSS